MSETISESIGNKKVKQKKDLFCKFVEENKKKEFCICTHDNPDPDAIASAFGLKKILQFLGVEYVRIYYCGEISHPQNRAMNNILSINIEKWNKRPEGENGDHVYIFVDCSVNQKNMSITAQPSIVIDHHKVSAPKDVLFIHDEVGACATLIADLMLSIPPHKIEDSSYFCFDPDSDEIQEIASALAIGIKTDTIDFRSETTTEDDFRAYKLLSRFLNDDKFNKIVNYELPPYMFESEETAWRNKVLEPPNLITGLGYIDPPRSDCIPYLADKMMRLQGIQTVVVYAFVGNGVRASVRTTSATIDASNLCKEMFGESNAGGKYGSAGATVTLNLFETDEMAAEDQRKFWEVLKTTIEGKFRKLVQK